MRHSRIILLASVLLCSASARSHAQYAGGNGDGYSLQSSSDVLLDGTVIDLGAKYRGGSGDGYASIISIEIVLTIEDITALESVPESFKLYQNYPNPFNPSTRIRIDIPVSSRDVARTRVSISNIRGQVVRVLVDEARTPGSYEINWDGRDEQGLPVPSGLYLYTVRFGEVEATKNMLLVK